jgi:hypothetical protein
MIEVTDVADGRLIFHGEHVLESDDVFVAGSGDINVAEAECAFDGVDLEALHGSLQGVDRVDLGENSSGAVGTERVDAALSDIAVAADDDFSSEHDISRVLEAVSKRRSFSLSKKTNPKHRIPTLTFGNPYSGADKEFLVEHKQFTPIVC